MRRFEQVLRTTWTIRQQSIAPEFIAEDRKEKVTANDSEVAELA